MTTQNKQLTVYLSKSLLLSDNFLNPIRQTLIGLGFKVTEYDKTTIYSDKDLKEADFVLLVPFESPIEIDRSKWDVYVGKGQYSEANYCFQHNKPLFVYHGLNYYPDILVSKLQESNSLYSPEVNNSQDWKGKYGILPTYVVGSKPVDLYPFIEGYFRLWEYPLTPKECYPGNYKLLLLK